MLLRLVPKEKFCLIFPKALDLEKSDLGDVQLIRYTPKKEEDTRHKYFFINTARENFTMKLVFVDKSVLFIPVSVYTNRNWTICSPFEVHIYTLQYNPKFSFVQFYDGLYCQYESENGYIKFVNLNVYTYRFTFRCNSGVIEHLDRGNNSLFITELDDIHCKVSLIIEPSETVIAVTNDILMFNAQRSR